MGISTLFHYRVERPHLEAGRYKEDQRIGKIFFCLHRGLALRRNIENWTTGNKRSRSLIDLDRDFQLKIKQRPHASHPLIFSYHKVGTVSWRSLIASSEALLKARSAAPLTSRPFGPLLFTSLDFPLSHR
jgi:hypothetical protein